MMSGDIEDLVRRVVDQMLTRQAHPRIATVTSYDPNRHAIKAKQQPEGHETGWVPISTQHVGSGIGVAIGPNVGDQVILGYHEGDIESPFVMGRLHSDQARPPVAQSGEVVVQTSNSMVKIDQAGNITQSAGAGMTVSAQQSMSMSTQQSMSMTSSGGMTQSSGGNFAISAGGSIALTGAQFTYNGGNVGNFSGPASSAANNIVTFADATGKVGEDSGVAVGSLVAGPASAVDGNIATFNGTTGKIAKDSGVAVSSLASTNSPQFTGSPTAPTQTPGDSSTKIATTAFVAGQSVITSATVQTASGTAITFTGIPAGVKEVTIMAKDVSFSSNDNLSMRIGPSSGVVTTGYESTMGQVAAGATNATSATNRIEVCGGGSSSYTQTFAGKLVLQDATTNTWMWFGTGSRSSSLNAIVSAADIALSGPLQQVQLLGDAGGTFSGGTVNISWSK